MFLYTCIGWVVFEGGLSGFSLTVLIHLHSGGFLFFTLSEWQAFSFFSRVMSVASVTYTRFLRVVMSASVPCIPAYNEDPRPRNVLLLPLYTTEHHHISLVRAGILWTWVMYSFSTSPLLDLGSCRIGEVGQIGCEEKSEDKTVLTMGWFCLGLGCG